MKTILIGSVPRVDGPEHGVNNVAVPWALPHSRFTIRLERFSTEVLQIAQTVQGAMTILGLQ
jgi:transposase